MALNKMLTRENPESFSNGVQKMFSDIAPRYDFLNALLSCRRDRYWRKEAVNELSLESGGSCLDIATGTGDIALEIARRKKLKNLMISGMDFSLNMLNLASKKIRAKELQNVISLQAGSAEDLAFRENSFNGVVTAFGVRNFSDMDKGLLEMNRVLKANGKLVILEFSFPTNIILKLGYRLYFDCILPLIGRFVSGHSDAYQYLSRSVSTFPERNDFVCIIKNAGFKDVKYRDLTFGIVSIYSGIKNA
jgi:demethylmenaquinone methyltransferase/2-methoxy-6-polyprenyl-1,4-benzoquinol methylase